MSRILIYFLEKPSDRWFKGDHKWRAKARRIVRGPDKIGGIKSVFVNLCLGLQEIGAEFTVNLPFDEIRPDDRVGIIGLGPDCLLGYAKPNPILAGVAVAEHPALWPTLFDDYPVGAYVVHCDWVKAMYEKIYGPRVLTWAVGIDANSWAPSSALHKPVDFLVYDKVRWDHDRVHGALVAPVLQELKKRNFSYETIRYGAYNSSDFRSALSRARAMLFLCEHETQGLAYQEAMSCNVPILAWDPGQWLDPWRFRYGEDFVPATSVPFFDERCGMTFKHALDFPSVLDEFVEQLSAGAFFPRDYVLEHLTLAGCARNYLHLLQQIHVRAEALCDYHRL